MVYNPNTILPNWNAAQPYGPGAVPRYGTGPGDLGMADVRGVTGAPGALSMGYPAMGPSPSSLSAAPYRPSTKPFTPLGAGAPSSLNTGPTGPTGPAPSTPVQGNPFFNFLSSLFGQSGGSAQGPAQGMTGLIANSSPARASRGVDTLGNPVGRF